MNALAKTANEALTNYASERTLVPSEIRLKLFESNYSRVARLDEAIQLLPRGEDKCPVTHHFARQAKMYAREMFIPKGMMLTSRIHKFETISFLLKGDISVLMPDGKTKRLKAPQTIVSPAGTQRAGYTHEDTIWTCVHQTDVTESEGIEDITCAKTYDEYADFIKTIADYNLFLKENGITDTFVRLVVENMSDHVEIVQEITEIKPSAIQGDGIFATGNIASEKDIGYAKIDGKRTIYGRTINHSPFPNCELVQSGGNLMLRSIKEVSCGDELTLNYRQCVAVNKELYLCHQS